MGRYTTKAATDEQMRMIVNTLRSGYDDGKRKHRPDNRTAAILVLESNLGCRIGDILNLTPNSIIKDGDGHRLDIIEEKTGKKRTFRVPEAVVQFLNEYCDDNGISEGRIFDFTERAITTAIHNCCEYLGYDKIASHSFRKRSACRLYEQSGYDIQLVSQFLQHSSIEITQRYIMRSSKQMEEAISKIAEVF